MLARRRPDLRGWVPDEEARSARGRRRLAIAGLFILTVLAAAGSPLIAPGTARAQADSPIGPPGRPVAIDTPNDVGESITVRWSLSPDDRAGEDGVTGYRLLRAVSPDGPFETVASLPAGFGEQIDARGLRNGVPYFYRIAALKGDERAESPTSAPVVSKAQWFHKGRINTLVAVVVLSALIIYFIEHARKGGHIFIRKIAGLEAVDEAVGRATEMGRKILYIPGTQDMDNVQTLAGISILARVARLTAEYETPLEVPVSRSRCRGPS